METEIQPIVIQPVFIQPTLIQPTLIPRQPDSPILLSKSEFDESYFEKHYCMAHTFLTNLKKDEFNNPYRYIDNFISVPVNIDGEECRVRVAKNSYFDKNDKNDNSIINVKDYHGKPLAFEIISMILVPESYNLIRSHSVIGEFIKLVFKHIKDIMFITKHFNIAEINNFINDILKLRVPANIKKPTLVNHIHESGGEKYLRQVIISYVNYMRRNRYWYRQQDVSPEREADEMLANLKTAMDNEMKAHPEVKFVNSIHFIVAGNNREIADYKTSNTVRAIKNGMEAEIDRKYINNRFNGEEIKDMYYLINGNPIHSHFLKTYTGANNHYYRFQHQKFIENEFYTYMLEIMDFLDVNAQKMLKVNLAIMLQNN